MLSHGGALDEVVAYKAFGEARKFMEPFVKVC